MSIESAALHMAMAWIFISAYCCSAKFIHGRLCTGDRKNRCGRPFANDLVPVCPTVDSTFYTGPDVIPNPLPGQ